MTSSQVKVFDSEGNHTFRTQDDIVKLIQNECPEKRNFQIFQIMNSHCSVMILERQSGIETRFNAKSGIPIYEFHLGKKNTVIFGKVYSPNGKRFNSVSKYKLSDLDKIRYGRIYRTIMIKFL